MMHSAPRAVRNIVDYFVYFATILFIYSDVTKAGMMDSAPRAVRNIVDYFVYLLRCHKSWYHGQCSQGCKEHC